MKDKKVLLLILDGWGHGPKASASAIAQAQTPHIDALYQQYPNAELITYGEEVGLPEGQMGNSEVGHLNIGAGRVVYQELARINKAIRENSLEQNQTLQEMLQYTRQNDKALHLIGLLSDGGVHSHIEHLKALVNIAESHQLPRVYIHAFTDGRDVSPKSGHGFVKDLEQFLAGKKAQLASVVGRYYAMDRDKRWERVKLAYDLLVKGKGANVVDFPEAIEAQYEAGITDEFLTPMVGVNKMGRPLATIQADDAVLFYNFRTDRPRQLTEALTQRDFEDHDLRSMPLHYCTMTRYDEAFEGVRVMFTKEDLKDTLGEVLSLIHI